MTYCEFAGGTKEVDALRTGAAGDATCCGLGLKYQACDRGLLDLACKEGFKNFFVDIM